MSEENTNAKPKKKRLLYYIVLAVCVLLLIAATVLTVYFLTTGSQEVLDAPPVDQGGTAGGDTGNSGDSGNTGDSGDTGDTGDVGGEPSTPSGGEDTVKFVSPIENATCTVEYNVIYNNATLGWIYRHKAVDFEAAAGTEVRCMADGKVESISYSEETGNIILVDHGDGLKTLYRFVEPDASLKEGATVKKGEKLGVVAEAYGIERKDGEHLHLEVELNGKPADPTEYLGTVEGEK